MSEAKHICKQKKINVMLYMRRLVSQRIYANKSIRNIQKSVRQMSHLLYIINAALLKIRIPSNWGEIRDFSIVNRNPLF